MTINADHTTATPDATGEGDRAGRHDGNVKVKGTPLGHDAADSARDPAQPDSHRNPLLPHERDQSLGNADDPSRAVIRQAAKDIEDGQVDTDMRATPGLDAARREAIAPTPGKAP